MKINEISNLIKNSTLKVKVTPNSAKTEIKSTENGILKIALAAPPEKGKANKELLKFFKKEYDIKAVIKSGAASRKKVLEIL